MSCGRPAALKPLLEAGASGPDRNPPDSRRAAAAAAVRRGAAARSSSPARARTSRRAALAWALDQRDWIEAQLARAAAAPSRSSPARSFRSRAETRCIVWAEREPRTPRLVDGELRCGGPRDGLRPPDRSVPQAARARDHVARGRRVRRGGRRRRVRAVSVGDAGTRWGSCSSAGADPAQLAADPRAARRRAATSSRTRSRISSHLNHGPEFKALEARLFGPGVAEAKASLRRVGPRLRRIGRRALICGAAGRRRWLRLGALRRRLCCGGKAWSSSCWVGSPVPSGRTIGCCCG